MIRTVVLRGFGNGTFSGTIALVVTRGYSIATPTPPDEGGGRRFATTGRQGASYTLTGRGGATFTQGGDDGEVTGE